jgi:hypothetical protein
MHALLQPFPNKPTNHQKNHSSHISRPTLEIDSPHGHLSVKAQLTSITLVAG